MAGLRLVALSFLFAVFSIAQSATFTVNTTEDGWDFTPDGVCETATGNEKCTLRGAVQEIVTSRIPGRINLPAGTYFLKPTWPTTYGISSGASGMDVRVTTTIEGAGPGKTIIDATDNVISNGDHHGVFSTGPYDSGPTN